MSASMSGSSGSIALGSILISVISSPPVALTVTMPPPAEASTVSWASSSWAFDICSCICCTCWSIFFTSIPFIGLLLQLAGVECFLHQLDDLVFPGGAFLDSLAVAPVLAHCEGEREPAAGDLVERIGQKRCVLGLLGQLPVKRRRGGGLPCERGVGGGRWVCLLPDR